MTTGEIEQDVQVAALRDEYLRRRLSGGSRSAPDRPRRADRTAPLPLSHGQQQMWFLNRLDPLSAEFLVPLALRLRGPLDLDALGHAWSGVLERHEILRTRYALAGGEPVQIIDPASPATVAVEDLAELAAGTGAATVADEVLALEATTPFDLAQDWPVRIRLLRIAEDDHILSVVFHHIACDAWSTRQFIADLGALYTAHRDGRPAPMTPLPFQYADFAAAQRAELTGRQAESHVAYWKRRLDGALPVELPADRARPPVRDTRGAEVSFTLDADVSAAVRELATASGATPFTVLLAAFQVLVSRYTGHPDVSVGTVVSGRVRPEEQQLIGYLVNTLVLRGRWDGDPSFAALVAAARDTLLDAYDHQAVPFAKLVDELRPERDLSRTPLYQVAVTMHEGHADRVELGDLVLTRYPVTGHVAKCDLELQIHQDPDGRFQGQLVYAKALFDPATAERMTRHLLALIGQAVTRPDEPVSAIDLLDAGERALVLGADRVADIPVTGSLYQAFQEQAARDPDAVAVIAGDVRLTYGETAARAERLARVLHRNGVGPGSLVGVCVERGEHLVPTLLGVLAAGAGYVPLDPVNPADRLAFVVADAGIELVVTQESLAGRVPAGASAIVLDAAGSDDEPDATLPVWQEPDSVAYVIYTSGSTGRPKGCVVTHRNVLRLVDAAQRHFGFDTTEVWSLFHSYAFDVSVFEMWGALRHGGRLVVVPQEVTRSPEDFLDLLERERVTVLSQTPSAFRSLVALAADADPRVDRLALRHVVFAGEKLDMPELRPWTDRRGFEQPALVNMYGITETTVHTTYYVVRPEDLLPDAGNPIGHPLADLTVRLYDPHGRLVPVGVPGEIHVGGPGVAAAYLSRPALTAERFVPDPYGPPGSRAYRSGDLARRRADGSLDFLGRIDHQVKIRGYRVELGEIEAALATHPAIRDAVVLMRESPAGPQLVAYPVGAAAAVPDAAELRELLAQSLPDYMVPAAFVRLDALPLTANGKLDRRALPAPGDDAYAHDAYVAPRTPLEERVAAVWADVLGRDRVGVQDNFFDLGGDSIRAVALVGALRSEGLDLAVRDVFDHRTVSSLCEMLTGRVALEPESLRLVAPFELISEADRVRLPDTAVDAYPLSQLQLGMVIEMLADEGENNYHNVSSFRIRDTAPFDQEAFQEAVRTVTARHEVLRTSLHLTDYSVPLQLVHAGAEPACGAEDLRHLDTERATEAVREFVRRERANPFDLAVPGLMRFFAHLTDGDGWWISVTECHPILEGWSHHSLLMELLTAYRELRDGGPVSPYELPEVRFADSIAAELTSLASAEDRLYWQGVVDGHTKFTLPAGWADTDGGSRTTHHVMVSWQDLEKDLRDLATAARASLKSVMIAAHVKVLSQLTDEPRFHTGLVFDTRPEIVGADRVLGMYLNTLPLGVDRSARTWLELVRQVFDREVAVWPHRRLPLPTLQRELTGGDRLIDVFFNYQDFRQVDATLVDGGVGIDDSPTEFPLTVSSRNGHVFLTADSRSLSRDATERIAAMYRAALQAMVDDPDGDCRPALLPSGERKRLLGDWATHPAPPVTGSVLQHFEEQVRRTPDAIAVADGDEVCTYRDLDARAARIAHRLRAAGAGPGSVVAVLVDRGADLIAALAGTWKAGAAYLPMDPVFPAERIAAMTTDAEVAAVLTQAGYLDRFAALPAGVIALDRDADALRALPDTAPPIRHDLDELAYVIYTSGSTGRPKGVEVTHRGLANHVGWAVTELASAGEGGAPFFGSIAFDLVVPNVWAPLLAGQTVHVIGQHVDVGELGAEVTRSAPYSFIKMTPGHLEILVQQLGAAEARTLAPLLVVAGEAFTRRVVQSWRDLAPETILINEYGPTEASVGTCTYPIGGEIGHDVMPIGRPLPGMTMYVLDERLHPVPAGTPGELYVGGTGVARGYARRPRLTAERFVPDPYGRGGGRLYRTGDRVRVLADGNVEFLGRRDGQIKLRGYRIELGEIEAALTADERVTDARVLLRTDPAGDKQLIAYVVTDAEPADLRSSLARGLPEYMVPAAVVTIPAIPLNANGKVDHRALPEPDRDAYATGAHLAPRTPLEERVAAVWAQVLGRERVGVEDGFFELGGDSIRAVGLVGALRDTGLNVTVRDVFQLRTVAAVAAALAERAGGPAVADTFTEPFALLDPADRELLPAGVVDAYPLSQVQTGMLVETLASDEHHYHNVNVYEVHDDRAFDEAAFRAAVAVVVARHDALRTSIDLTGYSVPVQLVHAAAEVPAAWRDLRGADEAGIRRELTAFVAAERAQPFDLAAGTPLIRVCAQVTGDDTWFCVFTQSHAILDGWSNQLLLMELVEVYRGIRDGVPAREPQRPPVRFADAIAAELRSLASAEDRAYWQDLVAGHTKFELPEGWHGDRDAPRQTVRAVARYHDLQPALRRLAAGAGVALKSVLSAAFFKVLGQLTRAPRFHAGVVTHTRPEARGGDRIYGTFLNTLPFPADRSAGTWRELIRQVADREIEAWPHRHFPMLAIPRDADSRRLVDVFFAYLDFHELDEDVAEDGWGFNDAPNEFGLGITALAGTLSLRADSHTLSAGHAERIMLMFRAVLEAMAADADGDATAAYLPPGEAEWLLAAGTGPAATTPAAANLTEAFEHQVAASPGEVALVCGDVALSYAELDARANRVARILRERGVGADDLVGVCLERGIHLVPALLGIMKAGAGYVPLDPVNPDDRLGYVVADAGVRLVVTQSTLAGRVPGPEPLLIDADGFFGGAPDEAVPSPATTGTAAYVIYTSGTTGRPKGCVVSHGSVLQLMAGGVRHLGFDRTDVWTMFHSYAFDFSVWEMWGALLLGGRLIVVPPDVSRSPDDLLDLLVTHQVTVLNQTPSAFRRLVTLADQDDPRMDRLALRQVIFGGEALETASLRPWWRRFRNGGPALINMYGITETTVVSTFHRVAPDDTSAVVQIGTLMQAETLHLLDAAGHLVPMGVPGEICAGGGGVARAYHRRPALTAERFVPDPFGGAGARLYRSGDLARRRPDGGLEFLGRIDHQVKIRGYRIELGEIEAVLVQHPAVAEAVVVVRQDQPGEQRLVAYCVPAGPALPSAADLVEFAGRSLPVYMVPAVFMPIPAVPVTVNGKLDRAALPVPDAGSVTGRSFVAPRTPAEERIAAVWAEVLGVDRVGAHDGFFELGGDSIRVVALVGRLREAGLDVAVRDVFQTETVAGLADLLAGRTALPAGADGVTAPFALISDDDRARVPDGVVDVYPLSQMQAGMLVEMLADTTRNRYHGLASYYVQDGEPFAEAALRRAAAIVSARHDVLRTSFDLSTFSTPMQVVHARAETPIAVHDLRPLPAGTRYDAMRAHVAAERAAVFDVAVAPLLRIAVHLEDDGWRLSFTQSHTVIEGWSLHALMTELLEVYRSLRDGREPQPYEAPRLRFADSIAAELTALASAETRAYWQDVVDGAAPFAIPAAWAGASAEQSEDYLVRVDVRDLEAPLRDLAVTTGASLKTVLIAAHLKVISQLTAEDTVHTGLVSHVRPEAADADRVYGTYVNTLPIAVNRTAGTWRELVRAVFRTETAMWPHRHFPMPEIQRLDGDGRRLVEVLFSYLDFPVADDRTVDARTGLGEGATEFALAVTGSVGQGLTLKTRTSVLDRVHTERIAAMFRSVLEAMATDPDGSARTVHLPAGERQWLLDAGGARSLPAPEGALHRVFERRAAATPDAAAVLADGVSLSYRELNERANRLARVLRERGAGPETLVGVCVERGAELMPALLAVLKTGAAYVPLDPINPDDRLAYVIADSGAALVVTQSSLAGRLPDVPLVVADEAGVTAGRDAGDLEDLAEAANLAYVIYTSGSTGRPKGCAVTHGNVLRLFPAISEHVEIRDTDVWALFHSYAFDVSVYEMWGALLHGGTLVVVPHDVSRSPEDMLNLLAEHRVTMLNQTPSAFRALVAQVSQDDGDRDLALRIVMNGGEPLDTADLRGWTDRLGLSAPELVNVHGITETAVIDSWHTVTADDDGPIPIGPPLRDVTVRLLDRDGQLVPIGVPGEMHISGPSVARAYHRRPGLTGRSFVPDAYGEPGSRAYRTGDLARWRLDGGLDFVGRADAQVKIRGYRVELGEIEAVLCACPGVRAAVVVVREDVPGEQRLVAYCVPDGEQLPPAAELATITGESVPEYMVPSAFVSLAAIPLTTNGKLNRSALPAPEASAMATRADTAPRSAVQQRIADVWRRVLGLDEVGVDDGFFALGGDSVRGVALVGALRAEGFDLSVRDLFQHRTVAGLAAVVEEHTSEPVPAPGGPVAPFALLPAADRARLPEGLADAYPLSQNQAGMVVEMLHDDAGGLYHNVSSALIDDDRPFVFDALRAAVDTVAERHDVLRTSVDLTSYSVPLQLVWAHTAVPCAEGDLRGLGEDAQRRAMTEFVAAERAHTFDLSATAPLFRVHAHQRDGGWFLTLTQSHAILEGWSHHRLVGELVAAYRQIRDTGRAEAYEAPGVRFADAIAAELAALDSAEDRAFWRRVVEGHVPLRLPRAWAASGDPGHSPVATVPYHDLAPGLRTVADAVGGPLKSVLLAAHVKVMSQLTEAPAFHTGLVAHTRPETAGADRVHGMFLNTVPFPATRPTGTWRDLVRKVYDTETGLWPHRHFPMPEMRRLSDDPNRLVDVMFNYVDFTRGEPDDGTRAAIGSATTEFALSVHARGEDRLTLRAAPGVLGQEALDRIAATFRAVLEAIAADPDGDTRSVSLSDQPRPVVTEEPAGQPDVICLPQLFERQAATAPDDVAVVADGTELTYAGLNAHANRLARRLRELGAGPESVVGVCLDRGADLVPALLGVLKSGAGYLPLDLTNPAERLGFMLDDAGATVVVATSATAARLDGVFTGTVVLLDRPGPAQQPESDLPPLAGPDNLAYLMYTSGSTGRPKGVAVTHANVTRFLTGVREHVTTDDSDVWAMSHSYAFDVSVFELWGALLTGGRLVVVPAEVTRSPEDLLDLLVDHEVTVLCQTPSAFRGLNAAAAAGDPRIKQLAVRLLLFAGEPLDARALAPWLSRRGLGRTVVMNLYGPTESTVYATWHRLTRADVTAGRAPIGDALSGLHVQLLDPDGAPVPDGVAGELTVGGPTVARGYLNRPGLTADRFRPDPYGRPGSRMYRTGDLVRRMPDGAIDFEARMDGQVKLRGYRIELGEIEATLAGHAEVSDAVVVVREHGGEPRLVAYLVPAGTARPAVAELREWAARSLPSYMVPSAFVLLDRLPLNTSSKLDVRALPAPDDEAVAKDTYVAPATPVEARVAAVWSAALGVGRVGRNDSFFHLGGDSIRVLTLAGLLRAEGFDLAVRDVFERPVLADFCAQLRESAGGPAAGAITTEPFALLTEADRAMVPPGVVDAYPLTQNQLGMLVEMLAKQDGPLHYHLVNSVRFRDAAFDAPAFQQAVDLLVARHEVLRTSVDLTSGTVPMQYVHADVRLPVPVTDLSGLDEPRRRQAVDAYVRQQSEELFTHERAPLMRFHVHLLGDDGWQCTITMSHLILDGWSLDLLRRELLDDYRRLRDGAGTAAYVPPAARFADAVAAEVRALASEEDREFWRDTVTRRSPVTLPAAWGPEEETAGRLSTSRVRFDDVEAGLRRLATEAGAPLKSVLLAAFVKVMATVSAGQDVFLGLATHVRPELAGADRVLGMHLNTVPFPADRPTGAWRDLVGRTFADEARMWPHRHFPMPVIQREWGDGRRLIDVYFSFHDFEQPESGTTDAGAGSGFASNEFPLSVIVTGQVMTVRAAAGTVSAAATDRIAAMIRAVLEAMAADPAGDAAPNLLAPGEAALLLGEWAHTPARPLTRTTPAMIEEQAALHPDSVAVTSAAGSLTYRELDERANRFAHLLRSAGAGPETVVGVRLDRTADLPAALLGVWKAGAAYLPLDPAHPDERVAALLDDAGAVALITGAGRAPAWSGRVVVPGDEESFPSAPTGVHAGLDQLAYVIYTSGSTGRPKGVLVDHRGVGNHLAWAARELCAGEGGAPLFSSVAFDLVVPVLWAPLIAGRRLHLIGDDPARLAESLIAGAPYSFIKLTPGHLEVLAAQLPAGTGDTLARRIMVAGEAFTTGMLRRWTELAPATPVINEYGPTEASVGTSIHPVTGTITGDVVPIGRPLPGMTMYVLDRWMQPLPAGVPGELYVGGIGVARGYLSRPALTAGRFVPDPFAGAGARLYRTGDLARMTDGGVVEFLGRIDRQVKIRGYRIELGEVEAAIAAEPGIGQVRVVVREDRPGDRLLTAYLVPSGPGGCAVDELRTALAGSLPDYLVPATFVVLDELPLNANGKLDESALPAPAATAPTAKRPPVTDAERVLAGLWTRVLGVEAVGLDDNFFDLGGHSILVIRLVADATREGLPLTLFMVYQYATLAELAEAMAAATAAVAPPEPVAVPAPPVRALVSPQVPGAAFAVVRGGEIVEAGGGGTLRAGDDEPVTAETVFQAGSLSKLITAVGVLRLVDRGVLDLDRDVDQYLRQWRIPGEGRPITLRALLGHRSGLSLVASKGYRDGEAMPSLLDILNGRAPAHNEPVRRESAPGEEFRLANVHFDVVQQVVTDATGTPFADVMRTEVFEPFGMSGSSFDQDFPARCGRPVAAGHDPDGVPVDGGWLRRPDQAAAGLWTTAVDVATVLLEIRRGHLGRPLAKLSTGSAQELLRTRPDGSYGLGAVVDTSGQDVRFGHAGEPVGYYAFATCTVRSGDGWVVLTNGASGEAVVRAFA
jgi:amino acid adenylation domain-containing protein